MDNERTLALVGGRTLAYATAGNASSTTVVLYLHGGFTVGETSNVSRVIVSKNVHFISPTLPGWGNTSPPSPSTSYIDCLVSDMTALLDHLCAENRGDIKLYVSGGSFGTVPAQILYGATYDKFPYGQSIVGVLLVGPLTPLRYHKDYTKHMTWKSYFLIGPYTQSFLFRHVLAPLVLFGMARKLSTVDNTETFLRELLFDKMDEKEKEEFAQWRAKQGLEEGQLVRRFAENAMRSVAKSWEGFKLLPSLMHSDWGFQPDALDEAHSRPLVMIVTSPGDKEAPEAWAQYLAATYKNTKLTTLHGGHICFLWHMDEIWAKFLAEVE